MKIEVIICTESGYLEAQSKLLIYSIRKFGGILKDVDIFSYKPRKGRPLKKSTINFFEKNNVKYIELDLNYNYHDYPLANKPIVCAHREELSKADILIFLDSDAFFLKSPDFIINLKPEQVFMRPVDVENVGTDILFSGDNGNYWHRLYKELGVRSHQTVTTTVTNKKILEYYNSGMIITSVSNKLFQNWKLNFDRVMSINLEPKHGLFYVEQSVLSATISAMNLKVIPTPKEYNFPIHLMEKMENTFYLINNIGDLGHIHYHKVFRDIKEGEHYFRELSKFKSGCLINDKLIKYKVLNNVKISTSLFINNKIKKIFYEIKAYRR